MNSTHEPRSKYSGTRVKAYFFVFFPYLFSFVLLICVSSAPAQAGIWDSVRDAAEAIGEDVIREGADVITGSDEDRPEPEPSYEPPPETRNEPISSPPVQPSRPSPDYPPNYNYDRQKVARVQTLLNRLGYNAGTVDGLYGASTRSAIRAYQADRGLPPRGDVTARLLARLTQEAPPVAVTSASEPPARNTAPTTSQVAGAAASTRRQKSPSRSVTTRQTPAEWYGPEYQQCTHRTTVALTACVRELTSIWERRLDAAYQQLSEILSPGAGFERLQEAHALWVEYRDANCGFYGSGGGSIRRISVAECLRVMTKERARELVQAAEPLEGAAAEPELPADRTRSTAATGGGSQPAAAPGARPAEGCAPVDTAPNGSTVIAGTAPPEDVLCYRLATVPGRSVSIEVIEGRNIVVTVLGVVDAVARTEFTATSGNHDIRVGQLMRSVTNEPFRIRIVTAPAGAKRAAAGGGSRALAYVALRNAAAVAVVDLDSGTVVRRILVGPLPRGTTASADGSTVAVVNDGDATVSLIETATDTVVETLDYGALKRRALARLAGGQAGPEDVQAAAEIGNVVLGPAGRRVYIGGSFFGVLSVDRASDEVMLVGDRASGPRQIGPTRGVLKISTDGSRLYLPDFVHRGLSIIDTDRMTLIGTLPGFYARQFDVSDDGRFAMQYDLTMLSRGDLETFEVRKLFPEKRLQSYPGSTLANMLDPLEISPDGRRAYALRLESTQRFGRKDVYRIVAFDLETGARVAQVTVGKQPTSGMALTPDGRRIAIASPATNTLHVYDAASLDELRTIEVAPTPMAYIDFIVTKAGTDDRTPVSAAASAQEPNEAATARAPADAVDLRTKAMAFARSSIGSADMPLADGDEVRVELVELNGSAPREAFVYVEGPSRCGTRGCQASVLDLSGPKAVSIGDYIVTDLDVMPGSTGGWRDISVNGHRHVFHHDRYGRP